jgi:hypothetical protein
MENAVLQSVATVALPTPRRYLTQLCKHFEHRAQVAYEADRGSVIFTIGTCLLDSESGALVLQARAEDAEKLAALQDVVARHLLRFAFRDPPEIVWRSVPG